MPPRTDIETDCLWVLRHQAERALPDECCGFLLGRDRADGVREIFAAWPGANRAKDPTRGFELAPEALLAAERAARTAGLEVAGVYHSHPRSPAHPSAHDLGAATPDWTHLLIAPAAAEMRSFRGLNPGTLVEEDVTHFESHTQ